MRLAAFVIAALTLAAQAGFALAQPSAAPPSDEALPPGAEPVVPAKKPRPPRQGPVIKDAEGTEAPNRFEAETVIKSRYKLDGKPLEVDPD